jgi:hypothetical protein
MFIKLSLLSLYLRLSRQRAFRILVCVMVAVTICFGMGSIFTVALQCRPLSMLWNPDQPGKCIRVVDFYYANAGINIVTDVVIYLLPIKVLWGLQIPKRQRIGLMFLFGLGGLVVATSIIRVFTLHSLLNSTDQTWDVVSPYNWSGIELNVAIFITCGPAFKAFIRRHFPLVLGSSYKRTSGHLQQARDNHSFPLSSHHRHSKSKTMVTTVTTRAKQPDSESEENIVLPYHGIMRKVSVNVEVRDSDTASGTASVEPERAAEPGTAK